jgi:hypothetical protein
MIRVHIRGFSRVLSTVVVLAMMAGSAHAGQDPEPNYTPDGTWLVFATQGNVQRPFMDTYASLRNQHGLRGTVICTLAQGRILLPLGPQGALISVTGTQTGQGSWMRVQKNVYAFTVWRILTDPDGKAVGWVQFWGEIRPDAPDHFLGEISAAFYTLSFVALPIPSMPVPTEGWRVAVEGQ